MLLTMRISGVGADRLPGTLGYDTNDLHTVPFRFGRMLLFYPEVGSDSLETTLLLEVDALALVDVERTFAVKAPSVAQTLHDRAYISSGIMGEAMLKAFAPVIESDDAAAEYDLHVNLTNVPGEYAAAKTKALFAMTGLEVELDPVSPDQSPGSEADVPYFNVQLRGQARLDSVLRKLVMLLFALDQQKDYWMEAAQVDEIWQKGADWLEEHEKEQLEPLFFQIRSELTSVMVKRLGHFDPQDPEQEFERGQERESRIEASLDLERKRVEMTHDVLQRDGIASVLDLNPGNGALLAQLITDDKFDRLIGLDISYKNLQLSALRINAMELSPEQVNRLQLIPGSPLYRDPRTKGLDAIVLADWMEHIPLTRLNGLEMSIFHFMKPKLAIFTTPNADYNPLISELSPGQFRHDHHQFEWTRAEFQSWGERVASKFGATVEFLQVGQPDDTLGAPTQMAVFSLKGGRK